MLNTLFITELHPQPHSAKVISHLFCFLKWDTT
jgi:hypothetical protein